jgi:cell division protease FtsH
MARAMVTQWGMSDKLGPLEYGENQQEIFLGHSVAQSQNVSGATAKIIDEEIRELVDMSYKRAKKILTENIDDLHILGKGLLEYETLSGDEINDLLSGKEVKKDVSDDEPDTKPTGSVPTTKKPKDKGDNIGSDPVPES